VVSDPSGAVIPGANVTVMHLGSGAPSHATTDANGRWVLNMGSGQIQVSVSHLGFQTAVRQFNYDAERGKSVDIVLGVGSVNDTVTITAEAPKLETSQSQIAQRTGRQNAASASADTTASVNVTDLQRRVAGVLPIAVNVPRAGNAYRFVRPLVVDEETRLTFAYRTR
jgi:hypothetical protein